MHAWMHAMQCNAMQRNATQRNATQRNATQRNATQRNATQRNATQCNAIHTYIHTYICIYIYISFFRGIADLQTNQFSRLCSTDLLRGFLVLCTLEWRMCRLRRQQTETPLSPFPATQGIRTRPVRVVAGDRATKVGAGRLKRRTKGWIWEMGRRCCGEHWPAQDPKCCDISWVQGMGTCPAGPSVETASLKTSYPSFRCLTPCFPIKHVRCNS